MKKNQQIYFHVGLSKTGSTFLQHQIFPKLNGIYYLPTVKYRHALKVLPTKDDKKILVSREFDQQFEHEIKKFSVQYPNAHPIIVFREHSQWMVSNYKRFVKNGHPISFTEFIDIEEDTGLFKKQDMDYIRYIQLLEEHFTQPPLVLLYEDLKTDPQAFTQRILDYTGTTLDVDKINWNPRHVSYGIPSLKLVRRLSHNIQFQKKLEVHTKPKGYLYNLYANIIRYSILYGSNVLPSSVFPKEEFIAEGEVEAIKMYAQKEWEQIKELAKGAS